MDLAARPTVRIVLFTKPAVPGRVKTRMRGGGEECHFALTGANAARLHFAFLRDVIETLEAFVADYGRGIADWEIAWALDGVNQPEAPAALGEFEATWGDWRDQDFLTRAGNTGRVQVGEDLGARLWHGLSTAAGVADVLVAVGSDHPELQVDQIREAVRLCSEAPDRVVYGPADDGGYVLVALTRRSLCRNLFHEIEWSTPRVLAQSRRRAEAEGLEVIELETAFDCDDPQALAALAARLSERDDGCRHTRRFLQTIDLVEPGR